ncbi:MAG: DUF4364 family protein [Clostridiales bacterium]|nr:DUF4364 family protein [Clostridiales bacterium]
MTNSEISDGKIHILYLVKHAPGVSYQMLMDKCLQSLYLDFFNFSRCYNELVAGNLLDKAVGDTGTGEVIGSNETIRITRGGEAILEDIESTLNLQTLGYLKKAAAELQDEVRDKNSVKAFAKPSSDDAGMCDVTLSTVKDGRNFTCTFKAPAAEVDGILTKWREQSSDIADGFVAKMLNKEDK